MIDNVFFAAMDWEMLSLRVSVTLLHFLWQATLVGCVVVLLLRGISSRKSNLRYAVLIVGLFALPVVAALTFLATQPLQRGALVELASSRTRLNSETKPNLRSGLKSNATDAGVQPRMEAAARNQHKSRENSSDSHDIESLMASHGFRNTRSNSSDAKMANVDQSSFFEFADSRLLTFCVASIYLFGTCVMLLRLAFLYAINNRRYQGIRALTAEHSISQSVKQLARQLKIKRTPLVAVADKFKVPSVVGILKPVLLLPTSAVTGLNQGELEAIILHELAHIRRFDSLFNFVQRMVEAVFFFHPVVWWISRQVSVERENCCDDLAAKTGKGNLSYAAALLRMAELCVPHGTKSNTPIGMVAATGAQFSGFGERVQRLLSPENSERRVYLSSNSLVALSLVFVAVILTVLNFKISTSAGNSLATYGASKRVEPQEQGGDVSTRKVDGAKKTRSSEEPDLKKRVLEIINEKPKFDLAGGSWQSGAHDAMVQMKLSQLAPVKNVTKTLFEIITEKNTLDVDAESHALAFLSTYDSERLIPALKKRLESSLQFPKVSPICYVEVSILGTLGSEARNCVPTLLKLIRASSTDFRRLAMESAVLIDPHSPKVLQAIADQIKEGDRYYRSFVVYHLGRFGVEAKKYEDQFRDLLDDEFHGVQIWSALALIKTESDPESGFQFLYSKLESGTEAEKNLSATALASLGSRATSALMKLQALAQVESDKDIRRNIVKAIERIQKDDRIHTHFRIAQDREDQRKLRQKAKKKIARDNERREVEVDRNRDLAEPKVYWGKPKNGLRMGIRRSPLMKPGLIRPGDRVYFDILIANDSDKTIHICRDLNMHYSEKKLNENKVDLMGSKTFMSFSIPLEAFQNAMVSIAPKNNAQVWTSQFIVCEPGTKPKKYFWKPFCAADTEFDLFASHDIYYLVGGMREYNRRDGKSVSLQSGNGKLVVGKVPKLRVGKPGSKGSKTIHPHWNLWLNENDFAKVEVVESADKTFEIKLNLKSKSEKRFKKSVEANSNSKNQPQMIIEVNKEFVSTQPLAAPVNASITTQAKMTRERAEELAKSIRNFLKVDKSSR